jgi:hypothetical protein
MSFLRLVLPATLALSLAACSGSGALGGLGPVFGNVPQCDTGTQVQLANPTPFQNGVNSNIGQITIVANGNSNNLYNTYGQWNIVLTPTSGGNPVQGGSLSLVDGHTLTHPYASDFYYGSSVPNLTAGVTWNVSLQQNNGVSCTAVPLESFST